MRRGGWLLLIAVAVVSAILIVVVGPKHDELQMASDAVEFRANLEHPGRQLAAALIDVVFAASYGAIGVIGYRTLRFPRWLGVAGAAITGASACFDEIENVLLVRNIVGRGTLTDGWVDAMQVPGTLKWIGSPLFAVLMVWAIVSRFRRHGTGPRREA